MRYVDELTRLSGPKFHILELDSKELEALICGLKLAMPHESFQTLLPGAELTTPEALFAIIQKAFRFPDYFGHNWDALGECLNDLQWLEANGYLLCIGTAERITLEGTDFETFVTILERTAREWEKGRSEGAFVTSATPFHILFIVDPGAGNAFMTRLWAAGAGEIEMLT